MATRPKSGKRPAPKASRTAGDDPRQAIVEALMALLAERDFPRIGLGEVAERAGVTLAALRQTFDSKVAILTAFAKGIDVIVLAEGPAAAGEARDRLFEVMMRRFDALLPYRAGLRRLARSAARDPGLACVLHRIASRTQRWMLVAAGIDKGGPRGALAVQGVLAVEVEAMRAWFDDDDPGLARTMAALDRALRRGERAMQRLDDVCAFFPRFAGRMRGAGRPERGTATSA